MNRRAFLAASGGALAVGALADFGWWWFGRSTTDRQWLLVPHTLDPIDRETIYQAVTPRPGELRIFDESWTLRRRIPLPFFAHSAVQDARDPGRLYAISKWGRQLAVVDLRREKMDRLLECPASIRFFGHGLVDGDGDLLVAAHDDAVRRGRILRYRDLELVEAFDSFGIFPHEFRFHPLDPSLLVIANGTGRDSSHVSWVDVGKKRMVKAVPSSLNRNIGHFQFLDGSGERLLLYGVHSAPAVDLIDGQEVTQLMVEGWRGPKGQRLETLNAVRSPDDADIYWVSCPGGDLLLQIDVRRKKILALETHSWPKTVFARDGEIYISGRDEGLMSLRRRAGGLWRPVGVPDFGTGAHTLWVRPWDASMAESA